MKNLSLKIAWFYPDLMSTYGDRGNIIILSKRCLWRNIKAEFGEINLSTSPKDMRKYDLLFMGGAQDRQQEIVNRDLIENKNQYLKEAIEKNVPALFICGAYQFMGKYYKAANGNIIPGLMIFDIFTVHPGKRGKRLIGDLVVESDLFGAKIKLIGFENHGGRTYLSETVQPFAEVIKGFGNNGQDKTEGTIYNNAIGTYLHGTALSKNPALADYLISKALEVKYQDEIKLVDLDETLENRAKEVILRRYGIDR